MCFGIVSGLVAILALAAHAFTATVDEVVHGVTQLNSKIQDVTSVAFTATEGTPH
jgi:hypothetical protein